MIHMVPYVPTLGLPVNLLPLDFHSRGILVYHTIMQEKIFLKTSYLRQKEFSLLAVTSLDNSSFCHWSRLPQKVGEEEELVLKFPQEKSLTPLLLGLVADLEIETKPLVFFFFQIYVASSCFTEIYTK